MYIYLDTHELLGRMRGYRSRVACERQPHHVYTSLLPIVKSVTRIHSTCPASLDAALVPDSLGLLVGVEAVGLLHALDLGHVLLLRLLGGDALVDELLPGVLLCLALQLHTVSVRGSWQRRAFSPKGGVERTLRSNMPGAGALVMSSPFAILKRPKGEKFQYFQGAAKV